MEHQQVIGPLREAVCVYQPVMIPGSLDSAFFLRLVIGEALNRRSTF